MNRKKFLLISAVVATSIALPIVKYGLADKPNNPLEYPAILNQFCDEQEIVAIGKKYRKLAPAEDKKELLEKLLLTDKAGNRIASNSYSAITDCLNQKIHGEFIEKKTVIANGWVISITEARQCALFSLILK